MRERIAAQSVMEELVRHQSSVPKRSGVARFFGVSPLGSDSEAWYQGTRGEIAVGAILAKLPPDWSVFHALPIGTKDSDIDHLVVGPGGVFTINTKHHRGKAIWVAQRTFMVNGQKQPHIRNSEFEADRVTKLIRERMPLLKPAQPVIALVDPKQITFKVKPDRVKIIDARDLRRWLMKRPVLLDGVNLDQLVTLIDDPLTWRALEPTRPEALMAKFNAIDRAVRNARARRRLWAALISLGMIAGLIISFPELVNLSMAVVTPLFG